MAIPLVDLRAQHEALLPQYCELFDRIVRSGAFVLGAHVETFEQKLADYCQVEHAIGLSSGTDALLASMMAMNVGPGDEVITTPFTFFATAGCVARLGARPRFVDIEPTTLTIDTQQIEAAITARTKLIVPVHLFGRCADITAVIAIARKHGLRVIEDAAQAMGALEDDTPAGSFGDVGCLSFYPTKNLPAMGDAGACITNDAALAESIGELRVHGQEQSYTHRRIGGNFRIDALQAALLAVMLDHLDEWTGARREQAQRYHGLLEGLPLTLPHEETEKRHVFNCYTIRVMDGRRDALQTFLKARGVDSRVYYPLPLHLQPCFSDLGYRKGAFPVTEAASEQVLSLPIFPGLTEAQQSEVAGAIRKFFQ